MPRTRFAPSPTGYLHLGHAASAISVWNIAETIGAEIYLRIEDIDHTRCRPEFTNSIIEDLQWLGLAWDGAIRTQSEHYEDYNAVIANLFKRGLIYRCFRTRSDLAAQGEPLTGGALTRREERRRLENRDPFAWRLSLSKAEKALGDSFAELSYSELSGGELVQRRTNPFAFGDVILARKDIGTSYHLACCHDDAVQGITHVIRGEDLRDVTDIHVVLQALMGWPKPIYCFHPLILGADGKKLSKRNQDKSLRDYRSEGVTPDEIRRMCSIVDRRRAPS